MDSVFFSFFLWTAVCAILVWGWAIFLVGAKRGIKRRVITEQEKLYLHHWMVKKYLNDVCTTKNWRVNKQVISSTFILALDLHTNSISIGR